MIAVGSQNSFSHVVARAHTVPHLLPEAEAFGTMPAVLATGMMIAIMEWACLEHLAPYLEEGEGSLGTHVDMSHIAATPAGLTLTIKTEVESVDGRSVWFRVSAHDGIDLIGEGRHRRAIVMWDKFAPKAMAKASEAPK